MHSPPTGSRPCSICAGRKRSPPPRTRPRSSRGCAADYAASAENLRDAYLRRHGDSDPAVILEAVRCPEAAVYNMLQHLERGGGVRAYLARIGLGSDEIARLRGRLRETP